MIEQWRWAEVHMSAATNDNNDLRRKHFIRNEVQSITKVNRHQAVEQAQRASSTKSYFGLLNK